MYFRMCLYLSLRLKYSIFRLVVQTELMGYLAVLEGFVVQFATSLGSWKVNRQPSLAILFVAE